MKKIIFLALIAITLSASDLLSMSGVYMTNNTDVDFSFTVGQTQSDQIPGDQWVWYYREPTFPAHFDNKRKPLYLLPRTGLGDGTYGVQARIYPVNDPNNFIGFNQLLQDGGSTMKNSLGSASVGNFLSEVLPDTEETGKRQTIWRLSDGREICVTYNRKINILSSLWDELYISLDPAPCP